MFVFNAFTHDARVLKEASSLASDGWRVRLVAHKGAGLPDAERVEGFEVVRVQHDPWPARALRRMIARRSGHADPAAVTFRPQDRAPRTPLGRLASRLEDLARRSYASAAYAQFYATALRAGLSCRADVYCAHDLDTLPVAAIAATLCRSRLVYDSHELFLDQPTVPPRTGAGRRKWEAIERRLSRRADLVLTVNESIARELRMRYGLDVPPLVIRNVPRAGKEHGDASHWRDQLVTEGPVLLFTGGISAGRGLAHLVAALAFLPDVTLVLMGPADAAEVGRLQAQATSIGAGRRLIVCPPVAPDAVASAAAEADVGVVPYRPVSKNHRMSLPTKLFEYFAAGLPVVASDLPEIARLIRERDAGVLFDPDDPHSIAAAVSAVVSNDAAYGRFRMNALRAGQDLRWEHEVQPLLKAWRAL